MQAGSGVKAMTEYILNSMSICSTSEIIIYGVKGGMINLNYQDIWNEIVELSTDKGMTISELASKSGVPRTTLYNIKTGQSKKPSFELIAKVVEVLNVSLDDFRKGVESRYDTKPD